MGKQDGSRIVDPQDAMEGHEDDGLDFDLDDDDLSLLESDSEVDSTNFGDVEEPHILIDTAHLVDVLKPLAAIIKDDQEIFSKCVLVKTVPGSVIFYLNTGEFKVRARATLENTKNLLDGDFVVEFKQLYTVVNNSGSKFLIKKKDDILLAGVLGGEVEFECYTIDTSPFLEAFSKPKETAAPSVNAQDFLEFLSVTKRLMALSSRPEDRRVRVESGIGYFNFLTCIAKVKNVPFEELSLRAMDVEFLRRVMSLATSCEHDFTDDEYRFYTPNFEVVCPRIETEDMKDLPNMMEAFNMENNFPVSPNQMTKVLQMMKGLVGANGILTVKVENGVARVVGKTTTGRKVDIPIANVEASHKTSLVSPIAAVWIAAAIMKSSPVVTFKYEGSERFCLDGDIMEITFGHVAG